MQLYVRKCSHQSHVLYGSAASLLNVNCIHFRSAIRSRLPASAVCVRRLYNSQDPVENQFNDRSIDHSFHKQRTAACLRFESDARRGVLQL